MRELMDDYGMALVMAVIGIGIIAAYVWFIGSISVKADEAYFVCSTLGGTPWILQ